MCCRLSQDSAYISRTGVLLLGLLGMLVCKGEAQTPDSESMDIPQVHAQVELLLRELEYLRSYMGRPKNQRKDIVVSGVAQREVYFQALTLFRKADRLAFEMTYTRGQMPDSPRSEIRPADVSRVVNQALVRVRLVKSKLGLKKRFSSPIPDRSKTATHVFRKIVQANRQLNLMLDHQFSPSDVFQQVTLAMAYCERLIEQIPEVDSSIPAAPEFEPNKMPADVYRRLLGCFAKTQTMIEDSGEKSLRLGRLGDSEMEQVTPSDVYDIASLVVAEVAYLHQKSPGAKPPRPVFHPGRKFPSHVYQRVGILEKQLARLQSLVVSHPE